MKSVDKMLKSSEHIDFREALRYAIKNRKVLIQHKIDYASDEEAEDDDAEDSHTSNRSKLDSDSENNPRCLGTPLDVFGEGNDNMVCKSITLNEKQKEILRIFYYAV